MTLMDKNYIITDSQANEENLDDEQDLDYYDVIENINSNQSNLKKLSLSDSYITLNNDNCGEIFKYINNKQSNLESLDIILYNDSKYLKDIISNPNLKNIKLQIKKHTNPDSSTNVYENSSLELLNSKKEISINFESYNIPLSLLEKLSISDTLVKLEFDYFNYSNQHLLPLFSKIKTLKVFTLRNFFYLDYKHNKENNLMERIDYEKATAI